MSTCHPTGKNASMKDHLHGRLRRDVYALDELLFVNAISVVPAGMLLPVLAEARLMAQRPGFPEDGRQRLPSSPAPCSPSTCS